MLKDFDLTQGLPTLHLEQGQGYSIGRSSDNDIVAGLPGVSRHHAAVFSEGGTTWLLDTGSRGGTTHNGVPLHGRVALQTGDRIVLGGCLAFQVRLHARRAMSA